MSNIPYFEQLTDGEALNPKKAAALAFQVQELSEQGGLPYKSYVALLTSPNGASIGSQPTAVILDNSANLNITWTKLADRTWRGVPSVALNPNKTTYNTAYACRYIYNNGESQAEGHFFYFVNLSGQIEVYSTGPSNPNLLGNALIEIKIYP
jgi:hypothetical protein